MDFERWNRIGLRVITAAYADNTEISRHCVRIVTQGTFIQRDKCMSSKTLLKLIRPEPDRYGLGNVPTLALTINDVRSFTLCWNRIRASLKKYGEKE